MRPLIALLLCAIAHDAAGSAGYGAFPVTPLCASAWFIEKLDPSGKHLHLMAFVTGPPGWQDHPNFNNQGGTITFVCGSMPIRLALDADDAHATVQGKAFTLAHDNVFLVTVAGESATVRALGRHTLAFAEDDNPATELIARDSAVREALTGRPTPGRTAQASSRALTLLAEGKELSRKSDFDHACDSFKQAAELGLAEAEYAYGYCLQSGQGRAPDLVAANAWYEKAAGHGDRNAMFKLAWSAREGRGMTKDPAAALGWFRRCAARGDSVCQALVGDAFERGDGTTASLDSALAWYGVAAERGVPEAQYRVARSAAENDADPSAGLAWINVLEARRNELPEPWREEFARWRTKLEARLTAPQRARAQARADAWLEEDSKRTIERLAR
jgi:TPR repeat protein